MKIVDVHNLNKKFKTFSLQDINIELEPGYIMGFIGKNGAGKTTTLKSMLNIVHADSGTINLCGFDLRTDELALKSCIGFVCGDTDFYRNTKIKKLTQVIKNFYAEWDDAKYKSFLSRFDLDENKKIKELSSGMKVKYSLAIAMSHNARLLLLDEPTSGLDPAARDDLICLFREFISGGERSILFSTHITSDLEKCADFITYIKDGKIIESCDKDTFKEKYILISGKKSDLSDEVARKIIGLRTHDFGFEGMISVADKNIAQNFESANPSLEDIMIHIERDSSSLGKF